MTAATAAIAAAVLRAAGILFYLKLFALIFYRPI